MEMKVIMLIILLTDFVIYYITRRHLVACFCQSFDYKLLEPSFVPKNNGRWRFAQLRSASYFFTRALTLLGELNDLLFSRPV